MKSTNTNPIGKVHGTRSDATTGGRTAFSTAIRAATRIAPPGAFRWTPGAIALAA
jgi:hypothetical protein